MNMMKFVNKASASVRRKGGVGQQRHHEEEDEHLTSEFSSPTTVMTHDVGEIFKKHRRAFDENPISPVPIASDGNFSKDKNNSSKRFDESENTGFEDLDLSLEPSEGDYDFGHDAFYHSEQNLRKSNSSNDNSNNKKNRRSHSVQRPMQESSIRVNEPEKKESRRRAKSTGRSERREQMKASTYKKYDESKQSSEEEKNTKQKKSKMEKIIQLQEKNQRYKDEFRRVQKDRKALKKDLENKKLEIASLTKEIDTHIAETSILKLKLSEALQELDRTDQVERKDRSAIAKLQKELNQVRGDYNAAVGRVSHMREEMELLHDSINRKDEQIKSLTSEVAELNSVVDSIQLELHEFKKREHLMDESERRCADLETETDKLRQELDSTLNRTTVMVKEREDAISDLLKENEELKRLVAAHEDEQVGERIAPEEFAQLREEFERSSSALEESQDRNVFLEEEIEAWIAKGEDMENEIQRLQEDVEAWQRKAASTEETLRVVEASAQESARKANAMEVALRESEQKHKEEIQDLQTQHTEALLDQKERAALKVAEAEKAAQPNPQDLMLQKAVASRKAKQTGRGTGWGSVIQRVAAAAGNAEADEDLSEEQKRIKDLEEINADQEQELTKVKSDMVRLRSSYNDALYNNKKRIEQLEEENRQYAAKQKALEMEIAELRKAAQMNFPTNFPDLMSESGSASS